MLHAQPRLLHDRYAADRDFVEEVITDVPDGDELFVLDDWGPLDASWLLFYLDGRARLLHNATFLLDERVEGPEVYVVARRLRVPALASFGDCDCLYESGSSRGEPSPDYRLGLYRLRLHAPGSVRTAHVSPMQATGRASGPWLHAPQQRPGQPYPSSAPVLSIEAGK
jgi:hypothetical protein